MDTHALNMTPEEADALDWCRLALSEEQTVDCEEGAAEIAGAEVHEEDATELMVRTLARVLIRNVRAEMGDGGIV